MTTDNPGTYVLASGTRYRGQMLRVVGASPDGLDYLRWLAGGRGEVTSEDRRAAQAYVKTRRQPSQPDPVPRHWPSAFLPNKRRETGS